MEAKFLLDTDVMVDFLRGHPKAVAFVKTHFNRIILSTIVVAELYAGVRDDDEQSKLDELMSIFPVIPITSGIARSGGLYKRDFFKSHGVGLADAIIAATALAEQAELKTLNTKDYPMLKSLKPAYGKN